MIIYFIYILIDLYTKYEIQFISNEFENLKNGGKKKKEIKIEENRKLARKKAFEMYEAQQKKKKL
jgi:hypothetical protein